MTAKRGIPVVTLVLIVANLLAAFLLLLHPELADQFGFRSDRPSLYACLTSLFLHSNVIHLLGNMIFLAAVGASVELATGAVRFIGVYFTGGIVGTAFHYLFTHGAVNPVPFIGASGCIAGCAGYYSVRYTGLRVPLAPKLTVSVAAVTWTWVALQILGGFVHVGETGGTSYWAHLGGFAAGVVTSFLFRAPDLGQLRLGHEVLERMNQRSPAAAVAAAKSHLERHPKDPKGLRDLAAAYALTDDEQAEGGVIVEMLDCVSESERPALLARLVEIHQAGLIPARRRAMFADRYAETHRSVSIGLFRSIIQSPSNDAERPDALYALARLIRDEDPATAETLLRDLVVNYSVHPCVDMARTRGWLT